MGKININDLDTYEEDYNTYEKFTKSNRKQGRTKDDLFEPSGQSFDGRKSDSFISKRTKARS
jgi:hypothetical protein